jgi:hypothetical protein
MLFLYATHSTTSNGKIMENDAKEQIESCHRPIQRALFWFRLKTDKEKAFYI